MEADTLSGSNQINFRELGLVNNVICEVPGSSVSFKTIQKKIRFQGSGEIGMGGEFLGIQIFFWGGALFSTAHHLDSNTGSGDSQLAVSCNTLDHSAIRARQGKDI